MQFRSTVLGITLALLGAASLGAQAAVELDLDNGTIASAQALGPLGLGGTLDVSGSRGYFNLAWGTTILNLTALDPDFYSFEMDAKQIITLRVDAPLVQLFNGNFIVGNPVVGLYSTAGLQLIYDDDSGPGFDSLLSFTVTTPGVYYAAVSASPDFNFNGLADDCTADCPDSTNFPYHLQISAAPVPEPAAGWLLGSGLLVLAWRKRKSA